MIYISLRPGVQDLVPSSCETSTRENLQGAKRHFPIQILNIFSIKALKGGELELKTNPQGVTLVAMLKHAHEF